jgi:RNA polymerase sigma-B factor
MGARLPKHDEPDNDEAENAFARFAASRDEDLRHQLVAEHLGLAHQLARRFANRGEDLDDLVQVASLALIKSVDRFDPGRGVEFSTFATRTVIGELKRHFRDKGWSVRAPRRIQELYLELGHTTESLSHKLGRAPTIDELAEETGATQEAVIEALEAGQGYRASSINVVDHGEQEPLATRLGGDDPAFASADDRSLLEPALQQLSERDQVVIRLRFFDGLTQSEIATRVGVSQMHVSRLLATSLERLRHALGTASE